MLYRIYLYSSSAATGSAPAIGIVNAAVSTNSEKQWNGNEATHFMNSFDADAVICQIETELTDPITNKCKCHPMVKYPPKKYDQIGYIFIATSYAKAAEVLPRVHAIAAENNLVMYDAETNRSFYMDLVDNTYLTLRNRQQELHQVILKEMKPLWNVRRINFFSEERDKGAAYVVTIRKDPKASFEERNEKFYKCLSQNLRGEEKLICEDQCYTISGKWYKITYVLEGYKKHPNRTGFVENGIPRVDLLHRMGADQAFRWMATCSDTEKSDIQKRMQFQEMMNAYPNPAKRFVESMKITKWQRKQVFDIRYSGFGYYGSEILFHVVADDFYKNAANISVLKIEEESASFILPFINDIYPDFYARYYLTSNHLSSEMWVRILDRLREAKKMILEDTFNPSLKPYIEKFNLFVLADHSDPKYWEKVNKTNDAKFVFEHRYEVAYLYDVFIKWSEAQLEVHGYCDDMMFNIQGP